MTNPWLEIPADDYEKHMLEVGQAQLLNKLVKNALEEYKPRSFVLLGCSTGNGLEHIDPATTKEIHAVDINPEYIKIAQEKFKDISNIQLINLDIENDKFSFNNIDLCFAGLILEYVDSSIVLPKIISTLAPGGVLLIVIQKTGNTSFVSKTKYKSLEKLSSLARDIDENAISVILQNVNMRIIEQKEIKLNENKSLLILTFSC